MKAVMSDELMQMLDDPIAAKQLSQLLANTSEGSVVVNLKGKDYIVKFVNREPIIKNPSEGVSIN